jgi:hypothetical protein
MKWGRNPGQCIVCGAAHSACGPKGPIEIVQFPARDAAAAAELQRPPLVAELVQATWPPGQFTTGTYRRKPRGRR